MDNNESGLQILSEEVYPTSPSFKYEFPQLIRQEIPAILQMAKDQLSSGETDNSLIRETYHRLIKASEEMYFIGLQTSAIKDGPKLEQKLGLSDTQDLNLLTQIQEDINKVRESMEQRFEKMSANTVFQMDGYADALARIRTSNRVDGVASKTDGLFMGLKQSISLSDLSKSLYSFSFTNHNLDQVDRIKSPISDDGRTPSRLSSWFKLFEFRKPAQSTSEKSSKGPFGKFLNDPNTDGMPEPPKPDHQQSPIKNVSEKLNRSTPSTITSTGLEVNTTNFPDKYSPKYFNYPIFSVASPSPVQYYYQVPQFHFTNSIFQQNERLVLITTDVGIIKTINENVLNTFNIKSDEIISSSIWSIFATSYAEKYQALIANKLKSEERSVLVSGKIARIVKQNGQATVPVSLWVKYEKEQGILVWVIDPIAEHCVKMTINKQNGRILDIADPSKAILKAIYNFDPVAVLNSKMTLSDIIPSLRVVGFPVKPTPKPGNSKTPNPRPSVTVGSNISPKFLNQVREAKFFPILLDGSEGSVSAYVRVGAENNISLEIEIISLPYLAGMITVNSFGLVLACNSMFTKFLLGLPAKELTSNGWHITSLIPDFFKVVEKFHLLPDQLMLTGSGGANLPVSVVSPKAQRVQMYHRDGVPITVDLQIRLLVNESTDKQGISYACWITNHYKNQIDTAIKPSENSADILSILESPVKKTDPITGNSPMPSKNIEFPNLSVKITDYVILEKLGEGAYGAVKLVLRKDDPSNERRVLKQVVKSKVIVDSWMKDDILGTIPTEIKLLHMMALNPHPNIVRMDRFFEDRDHYYIEMGLHGFGLDLFDYIELHTKMTELEIKHIFYQVVCAVKHLHSQGVVHRDIKDENIILDQYCNIQLIDFGSGAFVKANGKQFSSFCGTLDYAAPEILTGQKYDGPPQDVWALGILLYTLVYKENPFYNMDEIVSGALKLPFQHSHQCTDLIKQCLTRDIKKRPTIHQVHEHGWFGTTSGK